MKGFYIFDRVRGGSEAILYIVPWLGKGWGPLGHRPFSIADRTIWNCLCFAVGRITRANHLQLSDTRVSRRQQPFESDVGRSRVVFGHRLFFRTVSRFLRLRLDGHICKRLRSRLLRPQRDGRFRRPFRYPSSPRYWRTLGPRSSPVPSRSLWRAATQRKPVRRRQWTFS